MQKSLSQIQSGQCHSLNLPFLLLRSEEAGNSWPPKRHIPSPITQTAESETDVANPSATPCRGHTTLSVLRPEPSGDESLHVRLMTEKHTGQLAFLKALRVMTLLTSITSLKPHTKLVRDTSRPLFAKIETDAQGGRIPCSDDTSTTLEAADHSRCPAPSPSDPQSHEGELGAALPFPRAPGMPGQGGHEPRIPNL